MRILVQASVYQNNVMQNAREQLQVLTVVRYGFPSVLRFLMVASLFSARACVQDPQSSL